MEEAGISVINMNGIFFQYFMKIYDGYELIFPEQEMMKAKKHIKKELICSGRKISMKKMSMKRQILCQSCVQQLQITIQKKRLLKRMIMLKEKSTVVFKRASKEYDGQVPDLY